MAASVTQIASSATAVTLLSGVRRGFMIWNASTANLYVKFGLAAALDDFSVKLAAGQFYETYWDTRDDTTVTGIWDAVNGEAHVTVFK